MAHLLLIDDDPALIPEQIRQAFPAPRYRVEVADTGAEGIKCVAKGPPEVILLDLRLPDQSGLEVYQQIRKIDARIPVIFVTLAKTADAATDFDATAALQWDLRGSTPTTEVNGEVTYTISVRNSGSGPAMKVRPTITLPPELVYLKAQPLMHKADGPRVAFEPVTIPAGGEVTYQVSARAIRATVAARVEAELAADVYSSGAVRKQEVTAIGSDLEWLPGGAAGVTVVIGDVSLSGN